MFKKLAIFSALFLFLLSHAFADENGRKRNDNKMYIHIGIASPVAPSDFKTGWTTGANVGLAYSKDVSRTFCLLTALDFNNFDFDSHGYSELLATPSDLMDVEGKAAFSLGSTVSVKWHSLRPNNSKAAPYFLLGLGVNYFSKNKVVLSYIEQTVEKTGFSGIYPAITLAFGSDLYLEGENLFAEPGLQIQMTPHAYTNFWYLKVGMGIHLF